MLKKLTAIMLSAAIALSLMVFPVNADNETVMPKDIRWTVKDDDFMATVSQNKTDGAAMDELQRAGYETVLKGYGAWTVKGNKANYTHTDGEKYEFTQSINAGLGNATKRSFYFTPQQACIVTVVYVAQSGRPMYIYQGNEKLAEGEEEKTGNDAAAITADINDPTAGDVIIYGGSSNKDLYGIFVDYYDPTIEVNHTVSGSITYNGSVDTSALQIVFENAKDKSKTLIPFSTSYSAELVQYQSYDIYVADADGSKVSSMAVSLDTNSISVAKQDITHNITVLDVAEATVTGEVKVHDINNDGTSLDLSGVTLTFTDKSDADSVYTCGNIGNDGRYNITLMSGREYNVTATGADGYEISTLSKEYTFVSGDATPFKNILFTETLGEVPFSATVKVGADKPYATVSDAITAIKKMSRTSDEAHRVTVEIDPGTYTEQVYLDAPYVTLKAADEANKPTIQFYYGIGYLYYSANGGFYSEDYAVAKTNKSTVTRWGAVCRVYGDYVNIENIIFKNTFSCEVVDEELEDGVEAAKHNEYGDTNGKSERTTPNYDARSRNAVERAAAIAIDKDYCEAYNCEFISSQDTFYTNCIGYVKDCYIEGGTDYIYGGKSIVFDNCTLAWHGYSDTTAGGYITANNNSTASTGTANTDSNGYLFRNSTVTNSKYYKDNKFVAGSWGRNWGGDKTQVVFDGVTLSGADAPGAWVKMGSELSASILFVNNVIGKNGAAVDTSGTSFNPNGTMAAKNYKVMSPEDYFGSWTPPHYVTSTKPDNPKPSTKPDDPEPSKKPAIKIAEKKDGNTVVTLDNITEGIVIAAKYNENALDSIKTAPVKAGEITIEGIEADKVMVWETFEGMKPVCAAKTVTKASEPNEFDGVTVDFTAMSEVPVYNAETGQGFVGKSGAIMPAGYERQVSPASGITLSSADGAKITESTGAYLHTTNNKLDGDDYNYGGLIYRVDTGKPGLYHIEVTVDGTQSDTRVAPTGMNSGNLTGKSNWDNAGEVPRTSYATWEDSTWTYDFGTGENFIEIEIEPNGLATESATKTVGVKSIKITPIEVKEAGEKPTIHIIGDSTQKTYTFNETISAWGQTLGNYFDKSKVNVVNYSMGGRAMKSNYCEGRFNEILSSGKQGDYVFIHSAHNDETTSTNRFSRGAGVESDNLSVNNENYNKWLNMYVEAVKARGMTPVLVTGMPRVKDGKWSESVTKPNGFNPDSPENMRVKAAADEKVGLAELYAGAKAYFDKLDAKEVAYIYNNIEAGETPANNAANGAKGDGTHYKEAASKQFSRIILQSIYDQSVAATDTYTDKAIMTELVKLLPDSVKTAAQTGNWSAVFPEMASDVSAVDIVPGAAKQVEDNYYYRNNIEKALQLGLLHKDTDNLFKPTQTITVGEYARGVEKALGLASGALKNYEKPYSEISSLTEATAQEGGGSSAEPVTGGEEAGTGNIHVTVEQPVGGTITVYNESEFKTATTDITSEIAANQQLADNAYYILTAPEDIVNKTDSKGEFAGNRNISTNYLEIRNNGTKQIKYTANADGVITMYMYFVDHKLITCENKTDETKATKYINNTDIAGTTQDNQYGAVTFEVKVGKSYELYTNGGTGRLFGIKYESTDYPQSTSKLNVNSGDTVRVSVTPAANYIVGTIMVNGTKIAEGKETTFTASETSTVTATLTAEPELVETTIVASDAPLTREVMGAILYDAYQLADKTNMAKYMEQNGDVPSPDDPNYDPNRQYESSPYIPITGWGIITDKAGLNKALYAKVKAAYNFGLIRPETGIQRGSIALGKDLQPTTEVTRAKAAKSLVFAFILTQPRGGASQKVPEGFGMAAAVDIDEANTGAQTTIFTKTE